MVSLEDAVPFGELIDFEFDDLLIANTINSSRSITVAAAVAKTHSGTPMIRLSAFISNPLASGTVRGCFPIAQANL